MLLCVSILSCANGAGRVLAGLTDKTTMKRGYFLALAMSFMSLFHLLNFILGTQIFPLYFTTAGVGLAYGMVWGITPTICCECFGAENYGQNWGWFLLGPALATLIYNSIAGKIYELHAVEGSTECLGSKCYQGAFLFACVCSILGTVTALILAPRTASGKQREE